MKYNSVKDIEAGLEEFGYSMKQLELLYPRIYEQIIPLSATNISPRIYFYWKKSGLLNVSGDDERGWVKINLIDYVWIKIVASMRDFGVSFEKIKETKDMLFTNFLMEMINNKDKVIETMRSDKSINEKKIIFLNDALELAKKEISNSTTEEFFKFQTVLGSLIMDLLIKNDRGFITISEINQDFEIRYFSIKTMEEFNISIAPLFDHPCLHIPIKSIIDEFFMDLKCDKYIVALDLLNLKEKKVIDAIRKRDFKEIIIKQDGAKESIVIEVEKDGDLLDKKAIEVKRILGLNEYSEVTIKFRNNKHLYFKNKTRL
jgi:hypothetical protein